LLIAVTIGIIAGMVLAMPPGLAGVGAMKYGLFTGIKPGNWFALSNGIMDFVYCFFAVMATSAVASDLVEISNSYPVAMLAFQIVIVAILIFFGYRSFREGKEQHSSNTLKKTKKQDFITRFENKGPFLFGFAIAITNVANPTFFGSLLSLTGYMHAQEILGESMLQQTLFAVGFGFGNFLWLMILMRLINKFRSRLSENMMARIQQLAGISFIGFGAIIGTRVLFVTKWGEILKYAFAF
jgi:threonine/homoserine/homoserine lactone efflux protein